MYVSKTCECCSIMYGEHQMFDDYICRYCHEDADLDLVVNDFRKKSTKFSRYVPESVRQQVFDDADRICQYCLLNYATDIDHILPYSFMPDHSKSNLIASCQRCNCIAGNKMFKSLHEKRQYIIRRLCGKRSRIPIWTVKEVDELEGSLKCMRRITVATDREKIQMAEYIESLGLRPVF